MKRRAGIPGPEILIGALVVIIAFLALVSLVMQIFEVSVRTSVTGACELETILHSRVEVPIIGEKLIEWNCPINGPDTITTDMLKQKIPFKLLTPGTIQAYGGRSHWDDEYNVAKYNIDQYVAQQAISCWKKAGQGDERIFEGKDFWGDERDRIKDGVIFGCGVCSVFYFDEDALAYFNQLASQESGRTSEVVVNPYLRRHPVRVGSNEPIIDFLELKAETALFPGEQVIKFTPATIQTPMAISFVRQPGSQFESALKDVLNNWGLILGALTTRKMGTLLRVGGVVAGNEAQTQLAESFDGSDLDRWMTANGINPVDYVANLNSGSTVLWVSKISDLKETCDYVANSFSDENLKRIWT